MADLQVINVGQPEAGYLTTESSQEQLKAYFSGLLAIAHTGKNEFPVNLDDIWRLVYERKDHAVRSLKRYFMQNVDYQFFPKKGEKSEKGRPTGDYYLTLSCLEFFVARKVRAVFEVYRQVFHKAVRYAYPEEVGKLEAQPPTDAPVTDVLQWIEGLQRFAGVGKASTLQLMEKIAKERNLPMPDYIQAEQGQPVGLRNLTDCIQHYNVKCSPYLFNRALLEIGYLVERTYTEKRKAKTYKVIVGEGLKYGENKIPTAYPNLTQPLWYIERFGELLEVVRLTGLFESRNK